VRRQPTLAGLAADVDLQADVQRGQLRRALVRQALCDLQPVHRVHPVEGLGHYARLVALQRADEVPGDVTAQVGQLGHFVERFLHVVLAELVLPGSQQ
jgi:hypothetical protein